MTDNEKTVRPRGACPSLEMPMEVADGLLARFRPESGLSADQVLALADAATAFGNGLIEVTARGNLQIRGLSDQSAPRFRAALEDATIAAQPAPAIEISPLAGLDPKARVDPRPLAARLRLVCDAALETAPLSPKLAIVLVTGGQILLDGLNADIRLIALREGWAIELGSETLGALPTEAVPQAVETLLAMLQKVGPRARAGDLNGGEAVLNIRGITPLPHTSVRPAGYMLGPLSLVDGQPGLRIGLPFGQIRARHLRELARLMTQYEVAELRTAPDRTFVLLGFSAAVLRDLAPALAGLGFWTRPDAAGTKLTICSGAEKTAQGVIQAADLAQAFYTVDSDLIDGSFHLHVSTCAKGCPHAGRPGIMLVGDKVLLYRQAGEKPLATLDPDAIESGIAELAKRVRDSRDDGEDVLDCLTRLGAQ